MPGCAGELRACGAEATLAHPLHAKALDLDGVLYLDEKNWQRNDLVLRENDATEAGGVATIKHEALSREAQLLGDSRRGDDAVVESESFGCCNAVYGALSKLARERRLAAPVGRATRTTRQQTRGRSS